MAVKKRLRKEGESFLDPYKKNFDTLVAAATVERLVLLECRDKVTGERVPIIAVVNHAGEMYEFLPIARLLSGNPYEQFDPPLPEGGFSGDGPQPH